MSGVNKVKRHSQLTMRQDWSRQNKMRQTYCISVITDCHVLVMYSLIWPSPIRYLPKSNDILKLLVPTHYSSAEKVAYLIGRSPNMGWIIVGTYVLPTFNRRGYELMSSDDFFIQNVGSWELGPEMSSLSYGSLLGAAKEPIVNSN